MTHVAAAAYFDFATVDEVSGEDYNWGYDPLNYNLPEGSYATDAFHGEVRVRECRAMVQALHSAGLGVVMDVCIIIPIIPTAGWNARCPATGTAGGKTEA